MVILKDELSNDPEMKEEERTVAAGPSIVPIHSKRFASVFGKADCNKYA